MSTGSLPNRAATAGSHCGQPLRAATAAAAAIRDGGELPPAAAYADLQAALTRYAN